MSKKTLYDILTEVDNINSKISNKDIPDIQKDIIEQYEKNPIVRAAIKGYITIEDNLKEESKMNKGIRKILPKVRDDDHNNKLKQFGELINYPYQLEANGIYQTDNLITTGLETVASLFFLSYIVCKYFIPEFHVDDSIFFDSYSIPILYVTLPLAFGILSNIDRFKKPAFKQAKYLDNKIRELF